MDSGMIGKIEKGKRYARETDRVHVSYLRVNFRGEHADHIVAYDEGQWTCDCRSYQHRGLCSHIIALEQIFMGYVAPAPMPSAYLPEGMMVG
ncbi:MAG: SWIM zinc finger family protein [Anaerolineae bacterium]|nr:MAG: SWIM zinc finger family protein [Anaerolineae bacterium]